MDFAELAEDIAREAEQALFLTRQIKQIDERVANLYADADADPASCAAECAHWVRSKASQISITSLAHVVMGFLRSVGLRGKPSQLGEGTPPGIYACVSISCFVAADPEFSCPLIRRNRVRPTGAN
ncbi:hypothetical protein [Rhodococcus pseudokoreensis]|uniref:hypothetical protein n=1 Tax=Rhodococcus pseudokoreensis TaxID=2811421 RepID=UPI003B84840E